MNATLSLRPVARTDHHLVAHIRPGHRHERFSGTVAHAFETANDLAEFHAICLNDHPVGFFQIDWAYASQHHFAQQGEPGLRAFIIDTDHQGIGIGSTAVRMLPGYLAQHDPAPSSLVLTVNMANPGAVRCYRSGGFVDTGEIYEGGLSGPQLVMRLRVD